MTGHRRNAENWFSVITVLKRQRSIGDGRRLPHVGRASRLGWTELHSGLNPELSSGFPQSIGIGKLPGRFQVSRSHFQAASGMPQGRSYRGQRFARTGLTNRM